MNNTQIIEKASTVKVLADYFRANAGWKPLTVTDAADYTKAAEVVSITTKAADNFIAARITSLDGKFIAGLGFEDGELIFDTQNEKEFAEAESEL